MESKFFNWLFSPEVFFAVLSWPGIVVLIFAAFYLIFNMMVSLILLLGFGFYVLLMYVGRTNYTDKFKAFSYVENFNYDVDPRDPAKGWIVVDKSECYQINFDEKDKITLKIERLQTEFELFKEEKAVLINEISLAKTRFKHNKKKLKKLKEKFSEEIEKFKEAEEQRKRKGIEEQKKKAMPTEIKKIETLKKAITIKRKRIKSLKIDLDWYNEEIIRLEKELNEEKIKANQRLEGAKIVRKELEEEYGKSLVDTFQYFICELKWSNQYPDTQDLILILPSSINDTFDFSTGMGIYKNMLIRNCPNVSRVTFVQWKTYKKIPYLYCQSSPYHIKKAELMLVNKSMGELLLLNAEYSYLNDLVSQIQNEFNAMKIDNLDLENNVSTLLNTLENVTNRQAEIIETVIEQSQYSTEIIPKKKSKANVFFSIIIIMLVILFIAIFFIR